MYVYLNDALMYGFKQGDILTL